MQKAPAGRGGAKPAKALGPHAEDIFGEDRQQIDGAAQEHGEHVEGHQR